MAVSSIESRYNRMRHFVYRPTYTPTYPCTVEPKTQHRNGCRESECSTQGTAVSALTGSVTRTKLPTSNNNNNHSRNGTPLGLFFSEIKILETWSKFNKLREKVDCYQCVASFRSGYWLGYCISYDEEC